MAFGDGIPDARRAPSGLVFDGTTLDFERDATTGRFLGQHWVDGAVWFQLRTKRTSIRSATQLGNDVQNIRYIDLNTVNRQVQDYVLSALDSLLQKQRIRLVSINVDTSVPGRIAYEVNYVNLMTGRNGKTPKLPFAA